MVFRRNSERDRLVPQWPFEHLHPVGILGRAPQKAGGVIRQRRHPGARNGHGGSSGICGREPF